MFVFIWLIVSLPTNNDALQRENCQQDSYCITFNEDEIKAETGLCAVIPCSFTSLLAPKHIIWYKCEPPNDKCDYSKPIYHSDKNKENIQPGFKGRVSLMEADMTQKNCSIMINDLKTSDSGSYQLRVQGSNNGFTYNAKTKLLVTDLNQKPSVMIPPLTEGQQATLTCTAPGLCCGSPPKITWMWRGKAEEDSYIIGNITTLKTENLTTFTQRHVSTLTFNSSADHRDTSITCKVSFTGGITTEETVTLNVTYTRKPQISGRTTVMEGDNLNLTCSVDSVPPSVIKWTKSGIETKWQDNILSKAESRKVYLQEKSGHVSFSFMNVTTEEAGRYICTATYQNESMTEEVDVKVNFESALGRPSCYNGFCITLNEGVITAEAGLCVVVPCSFNTADGFTPKSIVWFKCESWKRRCGDSDIVFHINRNKVPSEFLGRVLLLDPDVSQGNCSIMINDLTTSDSGSYQLKVNGLYHGTTDGVMFPSRTILSVKDLYQKSTVMVPPLTEGQQATLTCTAPGLCSGSPPNITWTWREKIEDYIITGSTTALKTEDLTGVTQRHSSTLTFKPSAKHHNTSVTCKVSFTGDITTEETVSLNVTSDHEKHCVSGFGALPWVIAGVSLSVHVFCMIYIWHLWNTRKKTNLTEDQTYMSLQKHDTSSEYDVIVQRPH